MNLIKNRYLLAFFILALPGYGSPQNQDPYLTGATLTISVDDWADIWLNGIPIVDSQRRTPESKGFQTIQCLPEHICYFRRENILAITNSNAYQASPPKDDQVGMAYVLRLRFSNGAQTILSSSETGYQKSFYLPDREESEPHGWHQMDFNDSGWSMASSLGFKVPGIAALPDPRNHEGCLFFSSRPYNAGPPVPGERHLFRRKFALAIRPNPYCDAKTTESFYKVSGVPMAPRPISPTVLTPVTRADGPTPGMEIPTATPTLVPTLEPQGSDIYKPLQAFMALATFTPTPEASPVTAEAQAQTILFDHPPANIYVTFADGPGGYRLEVMDLALHPVRLLFDKRVVAEHGEWALWDGKDEAGREAPIGDYWVVFSKEGKALNRIYLRKASSP